MRISCSSSVLQIVTDIAVAISPTCSQECLVSDLHLEQRYMTSVSDLAHFCFQAFQQILAPFDCACPNFGADSSHKLFYINCFPGISVHHILQNYTGLPDWPDLRRDQGLLSFAKKGIFWVLGSYSTLVFVVARNPEVRSVTHFAPLELFIYKLFQPWNALFPIIFTI